MKSKLTSRKFWVAVAAFLASVAMGFAGVADPSVCAVCAALSAGIYAACEAYVDGASTKSIQSITSTSITASGNSPQLVERVILPDKED